MNQPAFTVSVISHRMGEDPVISATKTDVFDLSEYTPAKNDS